uniref:AlNc14C364G11026 protein n=1 Tax=Albugo laibachii Nc14 TaxID=890382 RepID=F0WXT9_9STRA|nr:AlNc14C364G11026 [Albugo laibachii Nc14]|eukprot:CCA26287.1 AlNc14C364G11026 [Albugo laibachii Nc14]
MCWSCVPHHKFVAIASSQEREDALVCINSSCLYYFIWVISFDAKQHMWCSLSGQKVYYKSVSIESGIFCVLASPLLCWSDNDALH